MISFRSPSDCPTARLIDRMNEVAFRPNAISDGDARVDERRDCRARTRDHRVDLLRSAHSGPPRWTLRETRWSVTASSTQLGHLRAGGVVEEDEVAGALERRKFTPKVVDGKLHYASAPRLLRTRAYRIEMIARNGKNDGTVYSSPGTKNVVSVMATSDDDAEPGRDAMRRESDRQPRHLLRRQRWRGIADR